MKSADVKIKPKDALCNIGSAKKTSFDLKWGKFSLKLGERTHIMGILNITPDSFSDGGRFFNEDLAVERGLKMAEDGADIVDIGGESTRPGAAAVDEKEELKRVLPVIRRLAKKIKIPISIDTWKSRVAEAALSEGAAMVNDVTALSGDKAMATVVAKHKVPLVLMHMKGTPRTMQQNPVYKDLIGEIISYLENSIKRAQSAGVPKEMLIVDPGIGFGKTTEHNLKILNSLAEFKVLERPILIGTSRKSFIGNLLNLDVKERLFGTCAACVTAIMNGANIIRVHDVKQMVQAARLTDAILKTA